LDNIGCPQPAVSILIVQSYAIFVDTNQEYPWENERFIFWTLEKPAPSITDRYGLSMFGFLYYRDWEAIGKYIQDHRDFNNVSANEPDVVTNFYVRKKRAPVQPIPVLHIDSKSSLVCTSFKPTNGGSFNNTRTGLSYI